jgi:hypothetical protein
MSEVRSTLMRLVVVEHSPSVDGGAETTTVVVCNHEEKPVRHTESRRRIGRRTCVVLISEPNAAFAALEQQRAPTLTLYCVVFFDIFSHICQSLKAWSAPTRARSSDPFCARSSHCWASTSKETRVRSSVVPRAMSMQSAAACKNLSSSPLSIADAPRSDDKK